MTEAVMGVMAGVGLSAACGFRVFVPLLGMSIANMAGHLTLSSGFEWIGSWPALIAFATATVIEIGAYYVPWIDNIMDAAAIPVAAVAGMIVTASQVGDMSPFLKWTLAVIAGGGVGLTVQGGTVAIRAASSATTGGLGNFGFSTLELIAAVVLTVLAVVLPLLCFVVVVWTCYRMVKLIVKSPWLRRAPLAATGGARLVSGTSPPQPGR
jgi:hypothetical protein